jgi:hypothetical protein
MPEPAREALIEIATLLASDQPAVVARVVLALDDPDGYLRAHADRLDERGIDEAEPDLPWIALVDALADHDLLAEVDWKEADSDIVDQLRELRSSPAAESWAWWPEPNELPTHEFLWLAGDRLRANGTALAVLDIGADCYPLVLLPAERGDALVALAAGTEFTAEVLGVA